MSALPVAILKTGLVTSVGLGAAATCAALRGKLSNPSETRFIDSAGEWIVAHQVSLGDLSLGIVKLARMAALAIDEALEGSDRSGCSKIPLLLCVAEAERPGRMNGLNEQLLSQVQAELGLRFSEDSATVAHGRVAVAVALAQARALLAAGKSERVLIAAVDSLITWPTLSCYERQGRLLTATNSNGFMPGEGAGALFVGKSEGRAGELLCTGIGFAREPAHLDSGEPLRGEGLSQAMKAAFAEAACEIRHMDFRITDVSGEQYYFKEAELALSRILRQRKVEFDHWHPAECVGEQGAFAGATTIAFAQSACAKAYSKGPNILAHMSNDLGQRAVLALQYRGGA